MPKIECTYGCMNNIAQELQNDVANLSNIGLKTLQIAMSLPLNTSVYRRIRKKLISQTCTQISDTANDVKKLSEALAIIKTVYGIVDKNISTQTKNNKGFFENIKDSVREAALVAAINDARRMLEHLDDRSIYSKAGEGQYGGDQGSARNASRKEKQRLYEIYLKNNPKKKLTEKQFQTYLERMNSEGCGYVALVNLMMDKYYGREEEFERIFGYPMRNEKGDYNFNYLLVDLYSRMDNYDSNGNYIKNNDRELFEQGLWLFYDEKNDATGSGSNPEQRKYYFEQFLKEHGVNGKYDINANVTVDNYKQLVESGKKVSISYGYGMIRKPDGTEQFINGGHSMAVTGVTDDGKFVVSSWGEEWILDPNESFTIEDGKVISSVDGEHRVRGASAGSQYRISYETAEIN